MLRASVDLMGGEYAPVAILEAASRFDNIHFIFVGTQEVESLICKYQIKNYQFISVEYSLNEGQRYSNAELTQSSMYIAIEQVKAGNADFVLSAGPTGYYMVLARRILGTIANLNRPALAAIVPTNNKRGSGSIMLDLGANLTCDVRDLAKFGVMGAALAKFWLNIEKPRVGFVNVGSEVGKGPENIKQALDLFQTISHDSVGQFVECHHIMQGECDVVVADGFTGNCLLKFGEGMAKYFKDSLKSVFTDLFSKVLGLMLKKKIKNALMDPRKYSGAIFAGINGCVLKTHGGSDAISFEAAIVIGAKIAKNKNELLKRIEDGLTACDLAEVNKDSL